MNTAVQSWCFRDLLFVVDTLIPESRNREHVAELLQDDEHLRDAMLGDTRLLDQLLADEGRLVLVSPGLLFSVLFLHLRREMVEALCTFERHSAQRAVLCDARQVIDLLDRRELCAYLTDLLASFTRSNTSTMAVRARQGTWHRVRVNELDLDRLVHHTQVVDDEHRYWTYRRVADACLLLTGLFSDRLEGGHRLPLSEAPRVRYRCTMLQTHEEFEAYGRTFYRLAARQPRAKAEGREALLLTLSEQFHVAERPLAFLARRYLAVRRHDLYDVGP